MEILDIINLAKKQNKNILILATPRSGTHALGSLIESHEKTVLNLSEICRADGVDPLTDIKQLYQHNNLRVAQVVQLSAKIALSFDLITLKQHTVIVNLKRRNKLDQFASWMYFHKTGGVNGKWHNHTEHDTALKPRSIEATDEDIDLFVIEQLTDDFFIPDAVLYYEDLDFSQSKYQKNRYNFDIQEMFSNLDHVKTRLGNWQYYND